MKTMNCQYWQSKKSFCNINYIMNIKYCQQVHKMLTKKFLNDLFALLLYNIILNANKTY